MLEDPDKPLKTVGNDKRTGFTFRGKQIVLSKTHGMPFGGRPRSLKARGMEKGIYPEEKRIEAVTLFAATGNCQLVAELAKIPEHLVRQWRKQSWFLDILQEIRIENNAKLDAKFTEIVDASLDQLTDRVQNGDFILDKQGALVRKPISARDLSIVAAINVDKRQLLRGEPTSRSESIGKIEDKSVSRLEKLAETFENLAKYGRQPRIVEVIDIPNDSQDQKRLESNVGEGQEPLQDKPHEDTGQETAGAG